MKRTLLALALLSGIGAGVAQADFTSCAAHPGTLWVSWYNDYGTGLYSQTWTDCDPGTGTCCIKHVASILKSTDGGMSWHPITNPISQFTGTCGQTDVPNVARYPLSSGYYRITVTVTDCNGNVLIPATTSYITIP